MILGIDTSGEDSGVILLNNEKKLIDRIVWSKKYSQSKLTLKYIDQLLIKNKVDKSDLGLVVVNQGPVTSKREEASFTGLKIGVTIANSFSFALKIPVVGVSLTNQSFLSACQKIDLDNITTNLDYIKPIYPKKPNIQIK